MSIAVPDLPGIPVVDPPKVPRVLLTRPAYCFNTCPLGSLSSGFVYDFGNPLTADIAILLNRPFKLDTIARRPISNQWWLEFLLRGRDPSRVFISSMIRCRPPKELDSQAKTTDDVQVPDAMLRKAQWACREWDRVHCEEINQPVTGGLLAYAPDLFIITHEITKIRGIGAHEKQVRIDFDKAYRFRNRGFRPLVIMGWEPTLLIAPWLRDKGGTKVWRGHLWEGSWEIAAPAEEKPGIKAPAPYRRFRTRLKGKPKDAGKVLENLNLF